MIRLATIGTSAITDRFADAVAASDGVRIDAVFSRDAQRGRAYANKIGAPSSSSDLDALLHSGEVDAVYLGSPNGLHAAQARAAIDAGIHVFFEKPATPTAAEFAELVAAARARGLIAFEGMRNVYDPGMRRAAELLPQVGTVRLVSFGQAQYSARYDRVLRGETPNIFDPALAGGALFDLGVYPLSALIHLFGPPTAVTGSTVTVATGADGAGAAVLSYPGHVAQVSFSKIGFSQRPNEIQGERGTLEIDEITAPREITVTLRDGTRTVHRVTADANNMVYEVQRFAELVRGEGDVTADQERSLAVLSVIDAIRDGGAVGSSREN